MKKAKKITTILMITILFFMQMSILTENNKVKATTETAETHTGLYTKGRIYCFSYDGIGMPVDLVYYENENCPAYGILKGRAELNSDEDYPVTVNQLEPDNDVWRAVSNGYPYVSFEGLNCENEIEAYAATQMAIYYTYYNLNILSFGYNARTDSETRILNAFKQICGEADKYKTKGKTIANIEITEDNQNWEVDKKDSKYASKTYTVSSLADFDTYRVRENGRNINRFRVTDLTNKTSLVFKKGEKFKVIVPIVEMDYDGEYSLEVRANLKTKPVYHAETSTQQYAIVTQMYEEASDTLPQKFYANKTQIKIIKQDGEKNTPLADAKFTLLDKDDNVLFTDLKTDSEGICSIMPLTPGTYYLKEIQAPSGYYKNDEKVEVTVRFNERTTVTVNNFEMPEREYIEKPQDGETIEVGTKPTIEILPETGF